MPAEHSMLVKLRDTLTRYFNAEELRLLYFELDVDYDDLSGGGHGVTGRIV